MNDWWVLTQHSKTTRRQSNKPNKKQRANDKKKQEPKIEKSEIRNQTQKQGLDQNPLIMHVIRTSVLCFLRRIKPWLSCQPET